MSMVTWSQCMSKRVSVNLLIHNMKSFSFFLMGVMLVAAQDKADDFVNEYLVYRDAIEFVEACGSRDLSLCLKERTLRYIDSLPDNVDIGAGLRIKHNEGPRSSRHYASTVLPSKPKAREEVLDKMLIDRIGDYIRSHTIEFKIPDETINELDRSVEEGRKKKGGGGNGMRLRPMMMLLQLKAVTLGAIALKFIGLIAFKALLVAKVAFTIASIIALKKLVEQKHHTSTYEVVAHPHYEEHPHFDRSFNQELPYKGYGGAISNT